MNRRLFISFSGGETSGLMTRLLLTRWRDRYDEIVVGFANTGEENEETLEFVRLCDLNFDFQTVWLEAVVHHGKRAGTTHRVIDYSTASRKGEPYEDHIKKFGIPNKNFPHCTRELKLRPIRSYLKSIGWATGTYNTAIGIRADEPTRRLDSAAAARIVYPLLDWLPTTKPDVNQFWMDQTFRLNLMGYQGNCKWCWKKSTRKLLTIMDDNPRTFDFPESMEEQYGLIGAEFQKTVVPGYRRVFFRGALSTKDLRQAYADNRDKLVRQDDDAIVGSLIKIDLEEGDDAAGCSESCEVDFTEAEPV